MTVPGTGVGGVGVAPSIFCQESLATACPARS